MNLYLIRHGETAWTVSGQHTGRTDIPLTPQGEQEARVLGEELIAVRFTRAFTSPRQRATRSHGHFGRVLAARWIGLPVSAARHFVLSTASLGILRDEPALPHGSSTVLWNAVSPEAATSGQTSQARE